MKKLTFHKSFNAVPVLIAIFFLVGIWVVGAGSGYASGINNWDDLGVCWEGADYGIEKTGSEIIVYPSGASNDAGVISLDEPSVFCPGDNHVVVTILNFGINLINSVEVHWEVNGVAQAPVTHHGTLDTLFGVNSAMAQVNLGSYTFTNADYHLKVWTVNPNGQQDTVPGNDTLQTVIRSNLPSPSNLSVSGVTATQASFSWSGFSAQHSWIYVVVPQGASLSSGTPVEVTTQSPTATGLAPLTAYDVYVAELCPGGADSSSWTGPEGFITKFSCPSDAYCFTNAGATGREGPTQWDVDSAYASGNLAGQVTVKGAGIQKWTVPEGGSYTIDAIGAGYDESYYQRGARLSGEFFLNTGTTLHILAGQKGSNSRCGSGGTFVADDSNNPLIIAGGSGGQQQGASGHPNTQGSTATSGQDGVGSGISNQGGTNGLGGESRGLSRAVAHSGAGFLGDGKGGCNIVAEAFINGGRGALSADNQEGGFGGGGTGRMAGIWGPGGGGGYSGGGASRTIQESYGGGGGSLNKGRNQKNYDGFYAGHGLVIITPFTTGATNDAGVASLDEPSAFCPATHDVVVTVANFGINQIDSVEIHWTVNGVAQPSYIHTSVLDTMGGLAGESTVQITLGSFTFTNGVYDLKAWTANPNGQQDTVNDNDTIHAVIQSSVPEPSGLAVVDTTATTATFSWTGSSSAHNWIWVMVPQGDAPETGTPVEVMVENDTATDLNLLTSYDLYVAELCPGGADTSQWAGPLSFKTPFQCPNNAFCFTNAGATGATGPTQSDLIWAYSGTSLDGMVTSEDGIQRWEVPHTREYRITACGAEGGYSPGNAPAGRGACMQGVFLLNGSDPLKIVVGQEGTGVPTGGGTGGGGTFVALPNDTPLIVAAGGSGAPSSSLAEALDGKVTNRGPYGGNGHSSSPMGGGGGGGYLTDGASFDPILNGKAFVNGSQGGTGNSGDGGFGGGGGKGSSYNDGAGGGGYSGGDHTYEEFGAGSYNMGINQYNREGARKGHGVLIIEPLTMPIKNANDAGVIALRKPAVFCPGTHNVVVDIQNFGINAIDSVEVEWSVNGVMQPSVSYTNTLDTIDGTGDAVKEVLLGSYTFTNAEYVIEAWTSNPNGQQDTVNHNDTLYSAIQSSLPAPANLSLTDTNATMATFSWIPGSKQHTWDYVVVPAGDPPGSGDQVNTDSTTVTVTGLSQFTYYDIYVREACAGGTSFSPWAGPLTVRTMFDCPTKGYCFTTAGQQGRYGPKQVDLDMQYLGSNLEGMVTSVNGIQQWTVPTTGRYRISAYGAQGSFPSQTTGGRGAYISGEFILDQGQEIRVLVGQTAPNPPGRESLTSSGGGGSFVTTTPHDTEASILVIAGGGGGTGYIQHDTAHGSETTAGQSGFGGTGGTNGQGGISASHYAGAGGGFFTDGDGNVGEGWAYVNGGLGGEENSLVAPDGGGFGGGGSISSSLHRVSYAGGGGFSGGAAPGFHCINNPTGAGGGGGSYNSGENQINMGGAHEGDGVVIIEPLSTEAMNDAGVASLVEPRIFCPGNQDVTVSISNFGANIISSVDVEWEVNGVAQTPYTFTGTLDTVGGSGSSAVQVTLGSLPFTSASYELKAWTTNPNGQPDTMNINDTLKTVFQSNLPPPSNLAVTHVSGITATFEWSGGPATHNWMYVVVPQGKSLHYGTPEHVTVDSATATDLLPTKYYDVYVAELCPGGTDTSQWAGPVTFRTLIACPPAAYCFRTAGATGATGPTQAELDMEYQGTNLQHSVESMNGYQRWIVPQSGEYIVTAYGAAGGGADTSHMGFGGMTQGTTTFMAGTILYITVGQTGQYGHGMTDAPEGGFGGGGHGGTAGSGCPVNHGSSGGGASDIRPKYNMMGRRIIVGAGGGGGAGDGKKSWRCGGGGGGGGGYYGGGGGTGGNLGTIAGDGGTQSAGGQGGATASGNTTGLLGLGGDGGNTVYSFNMASNSNVRGGHGGGITGEKGGQNSSTSHSSAGGGGSSFKGGTLKPMMNRITHKGVNHSEGLVVIQMKKPLTQVEEYSGLEGFSLYQNRPNPTDNNTKIDFQVPYSGKATLEITDLSGRRIKQMPINVDAGRHTLNIDVSHLSPGVYFYSMTFDGYRMVRKMSISR